MVYVFHNRRTVNRNIGAGLISAIAPTPVNQLQAVGHPTATLFRTIFDFRLTVRIKSGGGTPPPPDWVGDVFPTVTVQCDTGGFPPTPADPGTQDDRILQIQPMVKRWRGPATAADLYSVDYWLRFPIDTKDRRLGTGSGTNYPTVTAYLWTYDQSNYWTGVFYDHRSISWQGEMSIIYRDTF